VSHRRVFWRSALQCRQHDPGKYGGCERPQGKEMIQTNLYKMSSEPDMGTHGTLQVELVTDFSLS
jgi:hypothetical protein